jgi:hypothetical protein
VVTSETVSQTFSGEAAMSRLMVVVVVITVLSMADVPDD